jgi:hypothetical protein
MNGAIFTGKTGIAVGQKPVRTVQKVCVQTLFPHPMSSVIYIKRINIIVALIWLMGSTSARYLYPHLTTSVRFILRLSFKRWVSNTLSTEMATEMVCNPNGEFQSQTLNSQLEDQAAWMPPSSSLVNLLSCLSNFYNPCKTVFSSVSEFYNINKAMLKDELEYKLIA